jgi:ribonuclease HI
MKHPAVCAVFLTMALMVLVACAEKPAQTPGQKAGSGGSSADAASIGTTVPTIVELSDMYVAPETYDLRMTVAEIIRGEKSLEFLEKAGAANVQTRTDSECVLARIRFEYKARGAPGDKPWELSAVQFSAFSEESKPYGSPSIVASQSGLNPLLRSGDSMECWLAFVVAKSDRKPVMTFHPGGAWFHLY